MNTSIHFRKLLGLLSLLALATLPLGALTAVFYGTPITISNPTPELSDLFGFSVSISNDKILIGAVRDNTGAASAGSAYLYDATTGALLYTFNNPTPELQDFFGYSVSIYGNKVLIGANNDNTGVVSAGSAYLYDATTGALLQTFNNPTPGVFDSFGASVSMFGDKVLIGTFSDDTGANNAGSAYLYDATTGALLHTFNNPTPETTDEFGSSVSISGNKILIGAHGDDTTATDTGSAYLYDATTGALLHTFNNPTPEVGDSFGTSVSISNDKILIGAPLDNTGATSAGSAYLYDATTGALLQTFNNPTPVNSDIFGHSVSISGDKVLIGSVLNDEGASINTGSAYLFETSGTLLHTFNNPTPEAGGQFGNSVSISGGKVLIGSIFNNTGANSAGSAYLYLPQTDTDVDGIVDSADNCPGVANPGQEDADGDGIGNVCDPDYNVAPTVGNIITVVDSVQLGVSINASANFTDPGILDTHTAVWDWGDNSTSTAIINEANGSGTATGNHIYTAIGVYSLTLTLTDNNNASAQSTFSYVVIYNPSSEAAVSGGGRIDSPTGAYTASSTLVGEVDFRFVAKYENDGALLKGKTRLKFQLADFDFRSTSYDWLIVSGASAQIKGSGTINDVGDYAFILSSYDGQLNNGTSTDKFRVKVWDKTTSAVIYDNQLGDPDNASATDFIEHGNIVVDEDNPV